MNKRSACFLLKGMRMARACVVVPAAQFDPRAEAPGVRHLHPGRRGGHEHHGVEPESLCAAGHGHAVVAGGDREHAACAFLLRERGHTVRGPAQLEGVDRVEQVLELEVDLPARGFRKGRRMNQGRLAHMCPDALFRRENVVVRDAKHGVTQPGYMARSLRQCRRARAHT